MYDIIRGYAIAWWNRFFKDLAESEPKRIRCLDGKILSLFFRNCCEVCFFNFISKALNSDFFVRNQGARRSMADAKAQKEDMESKLAELQSINKDEFRTPGFAIGIVVHWHCCAPR